MFLDGSRSASRLPHLPRRVPDQPIETPHEGFDRPPFVVGTELSVDVEGEHRGRVPREGLGHAGRDFRPGEVGHEGHPEAVEVDHPVVAVPSLDSRCGKVMAQHLGGPMGEGEGGRLGHAAAQELA